MTGTGVKWISNLDGNHAGCIWLQDCSRVMVRGVTARHSNGDGISWQVCHDVVVESCHSHDNADLGLHPDLAADQDVHCLAGGAGQADDGAPGRRLVAQPGGEELQILQR